MEIKFFGRNSDRISRKRSPAYALSIFPEDRHSEAFLGVPDRELTDRSDLLFGHLVVVHGVCHRAIHCLDRNDVGFRLVQTVTSKTPPCSFEFRVCKRAFYVIRVG